MPQIFKALATITAWILFIVGLVLLVVDGIVMPIVTGQFFEPAAAMLIYLAWGMAIVSLALSVVCMKLRQKME